MIFHDIYFFVIYRLKLWCFNMWLQDYFHQFKGHLTTTKPWSLTDSWHLTNYETDILNWHIYMMTIITGFHTSRRNHVFSNHQISQSFHGHHFRKMCLEGERDLWDWQLIMIKNDQKHSLLTIIIRNCDWGLICQSFCPGHLIKTSHPQMCYMKTPSLKYSSSQLMVNDEVRLGERLKGKPCWHFDWNVRKWCIW